MDAEFVERRRRKRPTRPALVCLGAAVALWLPQAIAADNVDVAISGQATVHNLVIADRVAIRTAKTSILGAAVLELNGVYVNVAGNQRRPTTTNLPMRRALGRVVVMRDAAFDFRGANPARAYFSHLVAQPSEKGFASAGQGSLALYRGGQTIRFNHGQFLAIHHRRGRPVALQATADMVTTGSLGNIALDQVSLQQAHSAPLVVKATGAGYRGAAYVTVNRDSLDIVGNLGNWPVPHLVSRERQNSLPPASLSADFVLGYAEGQWTLETTGAIDDWKLDHSSLASHTIGTSFGFEVSAYFDPEVRFLQLDKGRLHLDKTRIAVKLDANLAREGERIVGQAQLEKTACQDAYLSLPAAMRAHLSGMRLRGDVAGEISLVLDPAELPQTKVDLNVDNGCRVLAAPSHADPRTLLGRPKFKLASGETRTLAPGQRHYVAYLQIPPATIGAFVSGEDAKFFRHNGFDFEQINKSLRINVEKRRLIRGGSTISQQLIKNLFLSKDRSLGRKLEEAILTWHAESVVPKRILLERYLNIVELGPNSYGLVDGARFWFGVHPRQLSIHQAAFLAALTPAPQTLSAEILANDGNITNNMQKRVDVILLAMARNGYITWPLYNQLKGKPVRLRVKPQTTLARAS